MIKLGKVQVSAFRNVKEKSIFLKLGKLRILKFLLLCKVEEKSRFLVM